MRRTYRSKKDNSSGLDHKNVLTVEAKSTGFDAFYIQNIKLNKRDISGTGCHNYNTVPHKKVGKRKYVKRILKVASMQEEESSHSLRQSVYLTPDKSIHVKKAPDPFDLLLISSPIVIQSPVIPRKSPDKTCSDKKIKEKMEYNYFNSDTESNEENTKIDLKTSCQDISDVKSHELMVEIEDTRDSKCCNESINNIVKQIPFFTNINGNTQLNSIKNDHKLTINPKSPITKNSPLSSTPFKKKIRSNSIYNISPISMNYFDSPKVHLASSNTSKNGDILNFSRNIIARSNPENSVTTKSRFDLNSFVKDIRCNLNKSQSSSHSGLQDCSESMETVMLKSLCTNEVQANYELANTSVSNENNMNLTDLHNNTKMDLVANSLMTSSIDLPFFGFDKVEMQQLKHDCSEKHTLSSSYSSVNKSSHKIGHNSFNDNICSSTICDMNMPSTNSSNNTDGSRVTLEGDNTGSKSIYKKLENYDTYIFKKKNNPTNLNDSCNTYWENDSVQHSSSFSKETSSEFEPDIKLNKTVEDGAVSFVTTRRGNDFANNSIILMSDNSYGSVGNVEVDMANTSTNIMELPNNHDENIISTSTNQFLEETIQPNSNLSPTTNKTIPIENEKNNADAATRSNVIKNSLIGRMDNETVLDCETESEVKIPIVLQPGKKWERSLSIYKRMTTMADSFNNSLLDYEHSECKGRKYRQSVIATMEMQKPYCSLHNESINGRRSTFVCKPSRATIKIVKENRVSRASLCASAVYEDLKGFLSDDCDDTIVDLSKLSIGESVHEVTVLEKFHDESRVASARDYVLRRCNQAEAILFDECYPETELKNCHKIGEGVYGEVYLWRGRDGRARVLKVLPIAGDIKVNGEPQKGYHEIISEIVIAMELSALRAPIADIERRLDEGKEIDASGLHSVENATDVFNEVLAVRCVHGRYPPRLLELWELYDECKGSENDSPAALPARQHYLVLELRNAGQDLESYTFSGAEQAHALLVQLAFGLAVAEEALQFEHRDLHWGNVLISPTDQKVATFVLRGRVHRVARRGVACAIIDYSLSRVSLRGAALYCDLAADDSLFDAVGDRQFTVYRLMRDRLGNEWKNFEPYTNVLWLHYVADKMVTAVRYERTDTKLHKHYVAKIKAIKNRILQYGSAAQFVLTDDRL